VRRWLVLTWDISFSREEKLDPQPFHKQVCPGVITGAGGCARYSGEEYAGSGRGLLNPEGRELVSDGDARVERSGDLR
jgi:hypothetical protein